MPEKQVHLWIAVNEVMRDDYRETVVELALQHLPHASADLRRFARQTLSKGIRIRGFRSVEKAPVRAAKGPIIERMQSRPDIASVVICLWAGAAQDFVDQVREAGEQTGFSFLSDWSWEQAREGFFAPEDVESFTKVVDAMTENREPSDADHLKLASFWLSRAITAERLISTTNDQVRAPSQSPEEPEPNVAFGVDKEYGSQAQQEQIVPQPDGVEDTQAEQPATDDVFSGLDEVRSQDLDTLARNLETSMQGIDEVKQAAMADATAVLSAVENSDLAKAEERVASIHAILSTWKKRRGKLQQAAQGTSQQVLEELTLRPDLDPDQYLANLLHMKNESPGSTESQAQVILDVVAKIDEYNQQRRDVLGKLDQALSQIATLQTESVNWTQDLVDESKGSLEPEGDPTELTLSEAQAALSKAMAGQHRLEQRLFQLIESKRTRVESLTNELREMGLPDDIPVLAGITLGDLAPAQIKQTSGQRLQEIEQALEHIVYEQSTRVRGVEPLSAAADLFLDWQESKLLDLLAILAAQKRDAETVLLLAASNIVHPHSDDLQLDVPIVDSFLRGIEQLAAAGSRFHLLNLLAAEFYQGWKPGDPTSEAKLCLAFLAAQYSDEQWLPDWFLWQQFPNKWPVVGMLNWDTLWQAALTKSGLPLLTEDENKRLGSELENARGNINQALERDGGVFLRLHSLKSRRHQMLLSKEFMPKFVARLEQMQQIEENLASWADPGKSTRLLGQLEKLVTEDLEQELNESRLIDEYDAAASSASIDDSDSFHRRTSIRVLHDCAQNLKDFGQALLQSQTLRVQRGHTITREALATEIAAVPELLPLGQLVLDHLSPSADMNHSERDDVECRTRGYQQLVQGLLNSSAYALRTPRTVGLLTSAGLEWSGLLNALLEDLSELPTPERSAELLLERQAPNQALLLVQHLSLDMQKQAQRLLADQERETTELQSELLKFGGRADDLNRDRSLGRWRLVKGELQKRLAVQQQITEASRQSERERSRDLLRRIHELEEQVFEAEDHMPQAAFRLFESGFGHVRKAAREASLLADVESYLGEVEYRLAHRSWPLDELQNALERLQAALTSPTTSQGAEMTIEELLDLLERGELPQVGLSPERMDPSTIETRCALLKSWLEVCATSGFLSKDLSLKERLAIQELFRHFARMTAMSRVRAPNGSHVAYESPAIYSHWELMYPKAADLENNCVFVTLPGDPPTYECIGQLETLVDEREWLEWCFVFLFVPGCTLPIYNRLQALNQNRGLVIIDEQVIRHILLAEAASTNPVGRLRPLMLNARSAETVEIFQVTNVADLRKSIFVGRDTLIRQITSSGDNYAIYGGRRIGKSSVLKAIGDRLDRRDARVISHSFDGDEDRCDDACAKRLARLLDLETEVTGVGDFKLALQTHMDETPDLNLVLLLDEIDPYILANPHRHVLIEALRALSDRYGSRFRVVIAGFMSLYGCLQGRGPYTPTSDPWRRMLKDIGPLGNLRAAEAERIVREGFLNILGWQFENYAIPQLVVQRTGGHPAFAQDFCRHLQLEVAKRDDHAVRIRDVETAFQDQHPDQSFIAYVRKTLEMNLDPIGHYLVLWLALEDSQAQGFTSDQAREIAASCGTEISDDQLELSLGRLKVTSVVEERSPGVYEFSVPDYPLILGQLLDSSHMDELESKIAKYLGGQGDINI